MFRRSLVCVCILLAYSLVSQTGVAGLSGLGALRIPQEDVGNIQGRMVDTDGDQLFVGRAAIFLCDADSGRPIHRETKKPIAPKWGDPQIDQLWFSVSEDDGSFAFREVPTGRYRAVAQSWSGTEGFRGFDPNFRPSAFVTLHGVANDIEVRTGEDSLAMVRALGNHVLHITNDPEEPHALLLVSLQPTLGDGILGPYGWGREFCRNLIGVTQMELPQVTICGLPSDAAIHVSLMNYDNNPGFGAASFEPGQTEGTLRIIASWSNGHQEPPAGLAELVAYLQAQPPDLSKLIAPEKLPESGGEKDLRQRLFSLLVADNDLKVQLEGRGEVRLADLLAAVSYIELQQKTAPKKE